MQIQPEDLKKLPFSPGPTGKSIFGISAHTLKDLSGV